LILVFDFGFGSSQHEPCFVHSWPWKSSAELYNPDQYEANSTLVYAVMSFGFHLGPGQFSGSGPLNASGHNPCIFMKFGSIPCTYYAAQVLVAQTDPAHSTANVK